MKTKETQVRMHFEEKPLDRLIQDLPPNLQAEVRDFVEFLLLKQGHPIIGQTLRQDWAEALRAHREQYMAVELQHKALDWRGH